MEISDKELLERYGEGDVDALEELVRRYERLLFSYLLTSAIGRFYAEEIFQEVWIRVIRQHKTFKDNNFKAWLLKITRNLIVDHSRMNARNPASSLEIETGGLTIGGFLKTKELDPMNSMIDNELGRKVSKAVDSLPPEQKDVFVLRVQTNLSFKEVAETLDIALGTAVARMQYALAKLRTLLEKEYAELSSETLRREE